MKIPDEINHLIAKYPATPVTRATLRAFAGTPPPANATTTEALRQWLDGLPEQAPVEKEEPTAVRLCRKIHGARTGNLVSSGRGTVLEEAWLDEDDAEGLLNWISGVCADNLAREIQCCLESGRVSRFKVVDVTMHAESFLRGYFWEFEDVDLDPDNAVYEIDTFIRDALAKFPTLAAEYRYDADAERPLTRR